MKNCPRRVTLAAYLAGWSNARDRQSSCWVDVRIQGRFNVCDKPPFVLSMERVRYSAGRESVGESGTVPSEIDISLRVRRVRQGLLQQRVEDGGHLGPQET